MKNGLSIVVAKKRTNEKNLFTYSVCANKTITNIGQVSTEVHYEHANEYVIASLIYHAENTSSSILEYGDTNPAFTFNIVNTGEGEETLKLTLSFDAPEDWSGTISDGTTDAASIEITINGGTEMPITLNAVPGADAALVDYIVEIESLTNPGNVHTSKDYTVLSGITDLVIDNGGNATQWNPAFVSGLDAANNVTNGVISIEKFIEGVENTQLSGVGHLYYNVAWTFPSLTNDGVAALSTFLDNGGNLFLSGQDIGWDTWDSNAAANGTPQTRAFYTNYLSADYQSDGGAGNSQLKWEVEDPVFGDASNSSIMDIYNGNIYPDEIDPIAPAVAIYHYVLPTKTGGIRVDKDGRKVVYIGIDLAMIADATMRDQTIQLSHDWFHGLITNTEFDRAFKQSVGQTYPNPTNRFTIIPFENLQETIDLKVINALGVTVLNERIESGTVNYQLDLSKLSAGVYHCVLTNEKGISTTLPIGVVE